MSSAKTAAQLKKEAKAKRQQAAAVRGGAVVAKEKKNDVDEVSEAVDEATALLRALATSGSVSKSVADQQLAAARNVTGLENIAP